MEDKYKIIIENFKKFNVGNHTVNYREKKINAQRRAISGLSKMSIKNLLIDTKIEGM